LASLAIAQKTFRRCAPSELFEATLEVPKFAQASKGAYPSPDRTDGLGERRISKGIYATYKSTALRTGRIVRTAATLDSWLGSQRRTGAKRLSAVQRRWLRYEHDGTVGFGTLQGDDVHVHRGDMFGESATTGVTLPLAAVKLLTPTTPSKVVALWNNFRALGEKLKLDAPK
jgi:hypothetical protein